MTQLKTFQNILIGDTVTVLSGDRKGDEGKVLAIDRRQRTHFTYRCYHVLFPDGKVGDFEGIWPRTDKGKDMAKPLCIERVIEEPKPVDEEPKPKEKAPVAKPNAIELTPEAAKK